MARKLWGLGAPWAIMERETEVNEWTEEGAVSWRYSNERDYVRADWRGTGRGHLGYKRVWESGGSGISQLQQPLDLPINRLIRSGRSRLDRIESVRPIAHLAVTDSLAKMKWPRIDYNN